MYFGWDQVQDQFPYDRISLHNEFYTQVATITTTRFKYKNKLSHNLLIVFFLVYIWYKYSFWLFSFKLFVVDSSREQSVEKMTKWVALLVTGDWWPQLLEVRGSERKSSIATTKLIETLLLSFSCFNTKYTWTCCFLLFSMILICFCSDYSTIF